MQLRTQIEHSPANPPAFTGGEQQGPNPNKKKSQKNRGKKIVRKGKVWDIIVPGFTL